MTECRGLSSGPGEMQEHFKVYVSSQGIYLTKIDKQ